MALELELPMNVVIVLRRPVHSQNSHSRADQWVEARWKAITKILTEWEAYRGSGIVTDE
jgi:hypothetical protein